MTFHVTLLDLLAAPDADSLKAGFAMLLLAALAASGWVAAAAFRRLRREQQAVAEIRARSVVDQWNEAGAHAVNRPPTRLQRLLDEHEEEETLRRALSDEADERTLFDDLHDAFPEEESR
ncbi:hypothetical protein AB0F17_08695 [Nonomuraea sp. NPDC026600]|uniref:hypothetical protein n=1 Tax=Nonomuraea sp. NPDC026600 TaxID=3155363 RepID=UPI0033F2DEF0